MDELGKSIPTSVHMSFVTEVNNLIRFPIGGYVLQWLGWSCLSTSGQEVI